VINKPYLKVLVFFDERVPFFIHVAGVFFLSMAITFLFWKILPASYQQNDSRDYITFYEPVARNILNGSGFLLEDATPAIRYPPGFPIILAGIFGLSQTLGLPESTIYSVFVLLCMGISSSLLFLLSVKVWGLQGGWISTFIFMTYPFGLWLTKQPNSEIPFMVVFYASIYLFWLGMKKQKNPVLLLAISGVLAGIAMLIRPIAICVGFIFFGLLLVLDKKRPFFLRFFLGAVLILGNILTILPWETWVFNHTGQAILLSTGSATSIKDGLTFAVESKNYNKIISLPGDVIQLQKEFALEKDSMKHLGGIFATVENHFFKEPLTVIKFFLIKTVRSWYGTDTGSMELPTFFIQLFYISIILLSMVILLHRTAKKLDLLILVWSFVFYFWLMTIVVLSILRYMVPVFGLLFLLTPGFVQGLFHRLSFFRKR
jgi:4-amino-4-deoxy-L-arabinose transferase-like glycosyltransferase